MKTLEIWIALVQYLPKLEQMSKLFQHMLKWVLKHFYGFTKCRSSSSHSSHAIIVPPDVCQRPWPPGSGFSCLTIWCVLVKPSFGCWGSHCWSFSRFVPLGSNQLKVDTKNDRSEFLLPSSPLCCSVLWVVWWHRGVADSLVFFCSCTWLN